MKLTKAKLKEMKIFNSWQIAEHGASKVFIDYYPHDSRACMAAKWSVIGAGFRVDPNAHWSDYGCKSFVVFGAKEKAEVLERAKAWATEQFKISEWERDPFGAWQDKTAMDAVREKAKAPDES